MNQNEWADQFDERLTRVEKMLDDLASRQNKNRKIGYKSGVDDIVGSLRGLQSEIDDMATRLNHHAPKGHRANWGQITNELRSLGIFDNGR